MRHAVAVALWGVALFALASPANADHVGPLELEILIGGVSQGVYDEDQLGCSSTGGDTFACIGTDLAVGGQYGVNIDSWNLTLDSDPVVSGITAVTFGTEYSRTFFSSTRWTSGGAARNVLVCS